jgi:hypothetical protein
MDGGAAKDDSIRKNINGAGGSSALNGGFRPNHTPGRVDNPMVNVQPPRREDLQPSYAQTLVGESDQGNHGWYGSMSKSHHAIAPTRIKLTSPRSQLSGFMYWNHGRFPLLHLLS